MAIKITGGVKVPQGKFTVTSNSAPTWVTAAGTIGTEDEGTVVNFQFQASDNEQGTTGFTFSKNSGDFPAGLSMDSAGLLTGTASDVGSDTTSNFNLRVTDNGGLFADENFSMTIANVIPSGPQAFAWGRGGNGYTGLGTTTTYSSPIQIGALTDWASISTGSAHTLAVKTDGTLWAWGRGADGRLGDGTVVNKSSPVQIGSLTTWTTVAAGLSHSLAIKTNGTMWAWGRNFSGELGQGNTTDRSSPVQVLGGGVWLNAKISAYNFTLAVRSNNTLWAWGVGGQGKLGLNSVSNVSSPSQVTGGAVWSDAKAGGNHAVAVRTNGTLWSWGRSTDGEGGRGTTTSVSVPNQIGALTIWSGVTAGDAHSHAIKTTGALWSWGQNIQGQLGIGDVIKRSSPSQVGSLTDWASINSAFPHTNAIKTDGSLWAWGRGDFGQLVQGDTNNRSSPVQIGSETDWVVADPGNGAFTIGIRDIP